MPLRPKTTEDGREYIEDPVGQRYYSFYIDPAVCIPASCIDCEHFVGLRDFSKSCGKACGAYGSFTGYLLDENTIPPSKDPNSIMQKWGALQQLREVVLALTGKDSEGSE